MKRNLILFTTVLLITACSSVRERSDIGISRDDVIVKMGSPTYEKDSYVPIPPRASNEGLATKTMFYKTSFGNYYYYLNDSNIVVNSLFFNDSVQF